MMVVSKREYLIRVGVVMFFIFSFGCTKKSPVEEKYPFWTLISTPDEMESIWAISASPSGGLFFSAIDIGGTKWLLFSKDYENWTRKEQTGYTAKLWAFSDLKLFALKDSLKMSSDGGSTWITVGAFLYPFFLDSTTIFGFKKDDSTHYSLKYTVDAGNEWKTYFTLPDSTFPAGIHSMRDVLRDHISFANLEEGVIYVEKFTQYIQGIIIYTNDGGKHLKINEAPCRGPSSVICLGNGIILVLGEHLFRSEDGGENWTEYDLDDFGPWSYSRLLFITSKVGYAINLRGKTLMTEDGGESWTEINPIPIEKNQLYVKLGVTHTPDGKIFISNGEEIFVGEE